MDNREEPRLLAVGVNSAIHPSHFELGRGRSGKSIGHLLYPLQDFAVAAVEPSSHDGVTSENLERNCRGQRTRNRFLSIWLLQLCR